MTTPQHPHTGPYGQPGPYTPRPEYQPPPWQPGPPQQAPGPGVADPTAPACRVCTGQPAARVTIRAHRGLLLLFQFRSAQGPFCQVCGTALFRQLQAETLWQGWWSPLSLFLLAPFTLGWNANVRRRLTALTPPLPGQHRPQLPAVRPVHRQPLAWLALVPLAWICVVITQGLPQML